MDAVLMAVVLLLVATQPATASSLSCRNEDGQPVDW
jgi:hypothetical protein